MSDDRFCITATCASKFTSGMCIGNWKVFTLSLKHLTLLYPFRDGGGWQGSTSQVTDPERLQRAYVAAKESLTVWFYWDPDRMASFLMNNPKTQPVFTENQNEWPAFSQGTRPNGQFFHREPDQMARFFREPDQTARYNSKFARGLVKETALLSFISWSALWDQNLSVISKTAPDSLLLTFNGQSLVHPRAKDKVIKS